MMKKMKHFKQVFKPLLLSLLCFAGILAAWMAVPERAAFAAGNLRPESILCPDAGGRYTYTCAQAELGKRYALFVVPGIYQTTEELGLGSRMGSLLYIDQKTAEGKPFSFAGFVPSRLENSTVVLVPQDAAPRIVGYISKDMLQAGSYVADTALAVPINDTLSISRGASWETVKASLPTSGFLEVHSAYMETQYVPVSLAWREDAAFDSTKAGQTFRVMADVTPASNAALILKTLIKPFAVTITVPAPLSVPESISAVKEKTVYKQGETLSDADIRVKALYSDGTSRDATGWTTDISTISTAQTGQKTLTVTYTEGDITLQAKIPLLIEAEGASPDAALRVRFETSGGTLIPERFVKPGETLGAIAEPVKKGFLFAGWYIDKSMKTPCDSTLQIMEDVTLYADWVPEEESRLAGLRVTLANDHFAPGEKLEKTMLTVSALYTDGTEEQVTDFTDDLASIDQDTPGAKVLHVWYKDGDITKEEGLVFHIMANEQMFHTVQFESGCDWKVETQRVVSGEKAKEPGNAPLREGFLLAGWEADGRLWDFQKNIPDRDITLRAKWLKKQGDADFYCYMEEERDYTYTGQAWKPAATIYDKDKNLLRLNRDYTVKYSNNTRVSTEEAPAKILVTGKGNYTGSVEIPFHILPKDIADEEAVALRLNCYNIYRNAGYSPVPGGKYKGKTLKNNQDFMVGCQKLDSYESESGTPISDAKLKEAGWYLITVSGKGNFTGSRTFRFGIAPAGVKQLGAASLKLSRGAAVVPYTGDSTAIGGIVTLSFGKTVLKEGEDYALLYPADTVSIGKKQVIARALPGSALCTGEKVISYEVTGLSIKQAAVALKQTAAVYTGGLITDNIKSVTLKLDKKKAAILNAYYGMDLPNNGKYTLQEGVDYTVSSKNNANAGKAAITLTGKGLFAGKTEVRFAIGKLDLNDPKIAITLEDSSTRQNKAGAAVSVRVVHTEDEGDFTLREGVDYSLSYSANKAAGSRAKATIRGLGNYKGSVTKTFTIEKKSLSAKDISVSVVNPIKAAKKASSYVYKPSIAVYDNGILLKANTDYTIDYSKCLTQKAVDGGKVTGTVVLKAKDRGSYSGTKTVVYQVQAYSIADRKCTITVADQTYTGKPVAFDLDTPQGKAAFTAQMTLADGGTQALEPGEDFEIVSYSRNLACGTAKATIRGTGSYGGTRTVSFKIVRQKLQP